MPRARKKSKPESPATEPTTIAEALDSLPVKHLIDQAQADEAVAAFEKQRAKEQAVSEPAQSDALAEHLAARQRKSEIEPERAMPEPQKHVDDTNVASIQQPAEILGEHTAAVVARRPTMQPAPAGFVGVASFPPAGIRVNRGVERWNFGTAALQFDEKKPLSRASEYALMTKLQDAGFQYQSQTRQWERRLPADGMAPGDNTMQAVELAREIAAARNEGRGR